MFSVTTCVLQGSGIASRALVDSHEAYRSLQVEIDSLALRVVISTAVLISNHHYYQYEPGSGMTDRWNN